MTDADLSDFHRRGDLAEQKIKALVERLEQCEKHCFGMYLLKKKKDDEEIRFHATLIPKW